MMGFEPTTFRLEVERAIQLRHTDILLHIIHYTYTIDTRMKRTPYLLFDTWRLRPPSSSSLSSEDEFTKLPSIVSRPSSSSSS
jgi:hypothetical protein